MVKLASSFSRLSPAKVMVIGDLLLDTYTIGKARRISPEAPVAIVHVHHEEHRPGGSGNVVLNLVSLGAEVVAVGRIGSDWGGNLLYQCLKEEEVDVRFLFVQEHYKTPVKNRIIAENQQVVRVDHEWATPLPESLEQQIIDALPSIMKEVKVLAISDYGKGFLTPTLLSALIVEAKNRGIIIVTDPKGSDFTRYIGSTVIKPNLSEAYAAAGLTMQDALENVAARLLSLTQADVLMITRSEAGIALFHRTGERQDFPVQVREVKDVTGAGDTVLAMLAYALANQLLYQEAAQLCNVAAGIAIEHLGCARVTLPDLAYRLLRMDESTKVFDEDHLFALQQVLLRQPFHLLMLSQEEGFTEQLFRTIKNLAVDTRALVLYLTDPEPSEVFIEMLSSLKEVNFILLHQISLKMLCEKVEPLQSYTFKNGSLIETELEYTPSYSN